MSLPLKYNLRNLRVRWRSTLGAWFGVTLVVAVFVMIMALANGLRATYVHSGDDRNLLVFRKGALAESSSQITFEEVRRTRVMEGIARDARGEPLASAELIVLITMDRIGGGRAHVQVRGLGPEGLALRPLAGIEEGRMFRPGLRECIVSRKIARHFANCRLGEEFKSGKHAWKVVGIFDADKTAYESEIWMDADEARDAFHREFYCSITLRPESPQASARLAERIASDKSMQLRAVTEREYYADQTKLAAPIQVFGLALSLVMGLGAAFAAMNTMYAAVGARGREIGTLRVLGFRKGSIYLAFMVESLIVAWFGGMAGCLLALPMNGLATGTFNWATFAEVAFEFRVTPLILAWGMGFALLMGVLGGVLPARLAARKPILDALRGG
ncbi:MAG TPA: ABC transporter permease [Verrucomicrobiae bacterium]|nr:ABC transporter permease [Verrucomicrobiae bacterium]